MSFDSHPDAVTATPFHLQFMSIGNVMLDCPHAVKPKELSDPALDKDASNFYMCKMLGHASGKTHPALATNKSIFIGKVYVVHHFTCFSS